MTGKQLSSDVCHLSSDNRQADLPIVAFYHIPQGFSARSGMFPLVEALAAVPVQYKITWTKLQEKSWTLGHVLRQWGNRHYESGWNALVPYRDEARFLREIRKYDQPLAYFVWGEFASPGRIRAFRRHARALVGTFHCSARRLPDVLPNPGRFGCYDAITLMSETQKTYFLEAGIPEIKLHVLPHGVDIDYFQPPEEIREIEGPVRGLLIGSTERDHEFMAQVLKRVPPGMLDMRIRTGPAHEVQYWDCSSVTLLPHLTDDEFIREYREADVLIMPMLDCTANNVFLEAMACGTPVMTNRVGGADEYISADAGFVMCDKNYDEWIDVIKSWAADKAILQNKRPDVRAWAETFDWKIRAEPYQQLLQSLMP